jgi:hypothetical protein
MLNTRAMIQGTIIMVVRRSTRPEESAAVDTQTCSLRSETRRAPRPPMSTLLPTPANTKPCLWVAPFMIASCLYSDCRPRALLAYRRNDHLHLLGPRHWTIWYP